MKALFAIKDGSTMPWRTWAAAFAVAMFIPVGAATGSAAINSGSSAIGNFTVGSRGYQNQALITTDTARAGWARASTMTFQNRGTVSAGTVGSRGRLFLGSAPNGPFHCEGSNTFNGAGQNRVYGYSCDGTGHRSWWSWGVSLGWNGSGYNNSYTFKSTSANS